MTPAGIKKENLEIGTRLREARKARGLSQAKLAEYAETISAAIEKLENGEVLSAYTIVDLAGVLGVTPAWLLWGEPYAPMRIDYCQVAESAE